MEIMKTGASESTDAAIVGDEAKEKAPNEKASEGHADSEGKEDMFSEGNLTKDSEAVSDADGDKKPHSISARDKIAFVDAVVSNSRFTKDYSLLGGKLNVTLRSLTSDEVNAIATWTAKQGTSDSAGMMAGRYRKYLLAAQVASLNGVEMPPLEEPLYEHLGTDGKTVEPPGWIRRSEYYDGMGYAQFQMLLACIGDFDTVYSLLCQKAEDANFWAPDTP